ncbi:radical SAM family heme chaperone HemW [uncultured Dialister sp.]|uniref:radical SAM family heme chaperone HemW n=1 Tax=uncultured Dialister sp. TaxID=278064 RepID=UPI0025EA74EC|nr:radical SAM family heme chaperone HemW [uncultured Dialister sp.]
MKTLGLYIHIPFCRSRCDYCGFYSIGRKPTDRFVEALLKEMEMRSPSFKDYICDTVYLGGGTPSSLSQCQLVKVFNGIHQFFNVSGNAEITMEMNPCDMSESCLTYARLLGINRISVGVQSYDDRLLRMIGRLHTASEAESAVKRAYRAGFHNISLDLMYELPGQSVSDFRKSLLWAVHLPITHISVYSLILEKRTRFAQLAEKGLLSRPTEDESWSMYQDMCRILPHYGFERYEISSFARNGHRSKHNQKYWTFSDYLGLGPAASSRIGHRRFTVNPGVRLYEKALLSGKMPAEEMEELSQEDEIEEYCFLALRRREGINLSDFEKRFGADISHWYEKPVKMLKARKLLKEQGGCLSLTYRGAALGNFVFEQFLFD